MPSYLDSNQLNFMVFRYLQESGFTHAAFTLGYEAGINKSTIDGHQIPPSALVKLVQKGIQYIEMEANTINTDDDDDDYTFIEPWDLMTKNVDDLHRIVKEKKKHLKKESDRERAKNKGPAQENEPESGRDKERGTQEIRKKREVEKDKVDPDKVQAKDRERKKQVDHPLEVEVKHEHDDRMNIDDSIAVGGPEPMDIHASPSTTLEVLSSDVLILEGHTSEVFACSWSPTGSLLASGSGDSTACIWAIACGYKRAGPPSPFVLKHFQGKTNEKSKDVTTLDWNGEGTLLATGSYDGNARIWGRDGELKNTLCKHKGPIFSLKWNKKGDFLLSGSVDKTAIVWDMKSGECKQQFEFHSAPALDVDWRNNTSFATCSTDSKIYVCKVGENQPVKVFSGHQGEVNAIKWDPTGSLLASCSDDVTAKIWSLKQDTCVHDFREHTKEIYTIRWSPTGPGTCNANKQLVLASASFDSTIKLWDVEVGRCVHSLNGHRQPVYSVAFSPNGEYLASGSLDNCLHIWSVKEGKIVKTYTGAGGIFEVSWNREGDKIAACFSNSTVCVVDFRM